MIHIYYVYLSEPLCVFWNTDINDWSDEGCKNWYADNYSSTCICDHLTSFGILMDINGNLGEMVIALMGQLFQIYC